MITQQYLENRFVKEKEITFHQVVEIIQQKLQQPIKDIELYTLIECKKGVGVTTTIHFNKDLLEITNYNNYFIVSDSINSISINKYANITLTYDDHYPFSIYFNDYHSQLHIYF